MCFFLIFFSIIDILDEEIKKHTNFGVFHICKKGVSKSVTIKENRIIKLAYLLGWVVGKHLFVPFVGLMNHLMFGYLFGFID